MNAYFGFQKIKEEIKEKKVQEVFSSVANKYDIMNDIMSFCLHRKWKEKLIDKITNFPESNLLDLAGGTGDIAKRFIDRGGNQAVVYDLNKDMLNKGKTTIENRFNSRYLHNIKWIHGNCEKIPFKDNSFDYCTISFGLRNVTHVEDVLRESFRILKPCGKFLCLEFSKVDYNIVSKLYDLYSFKIIPSIGKLVAGSENSYKYLVESIRQFHTPQELTKMMKNVGYYSVEFQKMLFGVVAIHSGYKVI